MSQTPIHLWEADHPYYGPEGSPKIPDNYRRDHRSWADYASEMGAADIDMNLVWRWDWRKSGFNEDGGPRTTIDLFMVHPRKSKFCQHVVTVQPEDEPAIMVYLLAHWQVVQAIWSPFTASGSPDAAEMALQMRARRVAALQAELATLLR